MIDGHDMNQIVTTFQKCHQIKNMPCAIIAKTVKGKGISYMENQVGWHGKAPNEEQFNIALVELLQKEQELGGEI